jgi:hypothetical protein
MRDDFPNDTKDLLARRSGHRCSNPQCRQPTSGPQADANKSINVGVAAHITAASRGGPRYDSALTAGERGSAKNGIWLCQICAKMVDDDPERFSVWRLQEWRHTAELLALHDIQSRKPDSEVDPVSQRFAKIETMMADLLAEMAADLRENPLRREFVVLKRCWSYWGKGDELVYYYDDHDELDSKLRILLNHGLIHDITRTNTSRFVITEEMVGYLTGQRSSD